VEPIATVVGTLHHVPVHQWPDTADAAAEIGLPRGIDSHIGMLAYRQGANGTGLRDEDDSNDLMLLVSEATVHGVY